MSLYLVSKKIIVSRNVLSEMDQGRSQDFSFYFFIFFGGEGGHRSSDKGEKMVAVSGEGVSPFQDFFKFLYQW